MRHYGLGQWTDYVRGAAGADEAELSRHLEEGCRSCERVVASLRAVTEALEPATLDPESFGGVAAASEPVDSQVMELIWDSARAKWLTGDESRDAGRQLHFANSEFELNARIEDAAGGAGSTVAGRLQSRFRVEVGDLLVRAISEKRVVDSGSTGKLGEFELALRDQDSVELRIALNPELELIANLAEL